MDLLDKIKALCKEHRITLSQLEHELFFSRGSISKWNRSVPAGDKILAVAQYFNVTTDYLLDDNADISTLAAHHDGEDWTLAELKEIADFKRYVLSKRNKKH